MGALGVVKGRVQVCHVGRLLAWRGYRWAHWKWGVLRDGVRVQVWFSPVGPKVDMGTKMRDATSYEYDVGPLLLLGFARGSKWSDFLQDKLNVLVPRLAL